MASTMRVSDSTPSSTKPNMLTSENCTMGMPEAAVRHPPCFSLSRWGAWSVAMVSSRPSAKACRSASRSRFDFTAGLHFMRVPSVA